MDNCGVSVHYSSVHHNYYSAWKYVTKSDKDYAQSDEHPRLQDAVKPKTSNASHARCKRKNNHQRDIPWLKKARLKMKTKWGRGNLALERTNENVE